MLTPTGLSGCFVVEFDRRADERGWFQRAYDATPELDVSFHATQGNFAHTKHRGTVRGMHLQVSPHGESKLFHCIRGSVFDVAVDLRQTSKTFGEWFGITLTDEVPQALLIPEGFAHGYQALDDDSRVAYFASTPYVPSAERVLSPLNRRVGIEWPLPPDHLSTKDAAADPGALPPASGY